MHDLCDCPRQNLGKHTYAPIRPLGIKPTAPPRTLSVNPLLTSITHHHRISPRIVSLAFLNNHSWLITTLIEAFQAGEQRATSSPRLWSLPINLNHLGEVLIITVLMEVMQIRTHLFLSVFHLNDLLRRDIYNYAWSRVRDRAAVGYRKDDARRWHRRVYGGLVSPRSTQFSQQFRRLWLSDADFSFQIRLRMNDINHRRHRHDTLFIQFIARLLIYARLCAARPLEFELTGYLDVRDFGLRYLDGHPESPT